MKPILKLIIAIMLILCLADMPYGFYELVRFAAAGAFIYLSYDYFKNKRDGLGFLFAGLALLFQPFSLSVFQKHTNNTKSINQRKEKKNTHFKMLFDVINGFCLSSLCFPLFFLSHL